MSPSRILYQFPISHYCEKSRWQLDVKQLPYHAVNLLPGPHRLRTRLMAGGNTLPVLRDGKRVIGDSTRIAYYLEKHYPAASLLPEGGESRRQVIELEQQFDRYGVAVRRWAYGLTLDQPQVMQVFFGAYHLPGWLTGLYAPLLKRILKQAYGIRPQVMAATAERVREGLALIEARIKGDVDRYLVADRLTLADITAASMYAPLLSIPATPWGALTPQQAPTEVEAQLRPLRESLGGQWVLRRYQQDRAQPATSSRQSEG